MSKQASAAREHAGLCWIGVHNSMAGRGGGIQPGGTREAGDGEELATHSSQPASQTARQTGPAARAWGVLNSLMLAMRWMLSCSCRLRSCSCRQAAGQEDSQGQTMGC